MKWEKKIWLTDPIHFFIKLEIFDLFEYNTVDIQVEFGFGYDFLMDEMIIF